MAGNMVRRVVRKRVACVAGFLLWCTSVLGAQGVVASSSKTPTRIVNVQLTRVPLAAALRTITRQAGLEPSYLDDVLLPDVRVTMHVQQLPVTDALAIALRGTGLIAQVSASGNVLIARASTDGARTSGGITGTVTDVRTHRPLRGAKISVGANVLAETDANGRYRVTEIAAGTHPVAVRLIGYAKDSRAIVVQDAAVVRLDIALEPAAAALDQVVVTGTVVATELKTVPNAITVITARQIEERGITRIDQLFRGDVPGLFAQNQGSGSPLDQVVMFSRGATAFPGGISAGTNAGTNAIKTYVDGIELANPSYLSQIDPRSIERIEILTGPQASTVYGSNALNGVMQIFTKRGSATRPQITAVLLSGMVENNFSRVRTPQHDYSAQLAGVEGRLSYNAGGSWNYVGPWTPAKQTTVTSGYGGVRLDLSSPRGPVTADFTFRRSHTKNVQRGNVNQTITGYQESGWHRVSNSAGLAAPAAHAFDGQTLGLSVGYVPFHWWSNEIRIGRDDSDTENRTTAQGHASGSDTVLFLSQTYDERRSLGYTTTARLSLTSLINASVTLGGDSWRSAFKHMQLLPLTLTGNLTDFRNSPYILQFPAKNRGGFLQAQVGVKDIVFMTYGLRAEWNPNFGKDAQPNYAPRYGVAYVPVMGTFTAKLRASYGRSTRPPPQDIKNTNSALYSYGSFFTCCVEPEYGNFDTQRGNPELGPERQQGGEGGVELYFGERASLVVTRYNQTVDGLLLSPKVDSVRSLSPNPTSSYDVLDADGYGYIYQYQYLNVGSIRNQGWELQGSANAGPITTRATYSWTKSRTIGITPKYRAVLANQTQYQPGAMFSFLPEHTWALGVTYARTRTTVAVNVTGIGQLGNSRDEFFNRHISGGIRLLVNRLNASNGPYFNFNNGYALADFTAAHRFARAVEGVLQVQNLTNRYENDSDAGYATIGRQMKVGLRIRQ
jgi:outer membrane receptor protein involved in Fe transport